jgi:hypothetical protein
MEEIPPAHLEKGDVAHLEGTFKRRKLDTVAASSDERQHTVAFWPENHGFPFSYEAPDRFEHLLVRQDDRPGIERQGIVPLM